MHRFANQNEFKKTGLFKNSGFLSKGEIRPVECEELKQFSSLTLFFHYLVDINGTISSLSSLAGLWMREFWLDFTKCVQFPIECSLPSALVRRAQSVAMPQPTPYVFAPFDIYNDAADWALRHLRQQWLFMEIEAEANLLLLNTLQKLASQIFNAAKQRAAGLLLPKPYRNFLEDSHDISRLVPALSRLHEAALLRRVDLLGRSVDVAGFVQLKLYESFRTSLETVVSKFTTGPLTGVLDLDVMLTHLRLVHEVLCEGFTLDPFHHIYIDVVESVDM